MQSMGPIPSALHSPSQADGSGEGLYSIATEPYSRPRKPSLRMDSRDASSGIPRLKRTEAVKLYSIATEPYSRPQEAELANGLARRIIWYREYRQMTQARLARLSGLSASAVSDAESGQSQMTIRTLMRLADALGTTPGILFGCVPRPAEVIAEDAARRRF